jgi:hypothetical protein
MTTREIVPMTTPQGNHHGQTAAGRAMEKQFLTALRLVDVLEKHGGTHSSLDWMPDVGRRMAETIAVMPKQDVDTWAVVQDIMRRPEFRDDLEMVAS